MTTFSHLDESTPESAWIRAGVLDLPLLATDTFAGGGTIVVLAAHPDDEALGAVALLSRARDWDCDVSVVLFTAGEGSHPNSPTHTRAQLRDIRLDEFDTALSALNPSVTSRVLNLPDGALPECSDQVFDEIMREIAEVRGPVTIVSPYSADGHGDHEAVGAAALEAGRLSRALVLEYPIWYWHWASPEDSRWRTWRFLPDPGDRARHQALDCYRSQTLPLSEHVGDEAILGAAQLEHHDRSGDTFAVTDFSSWSAAVNDATTASAVFDNVHADRVDPWSVQDSEYEIAKRDTLLAHLPQRPYSHIVEIGCSIGALSRELARRSRRVTAIDASREALKNAEYLNSTTTAAGLSFIHATVPFEWPEGRFDAVVLSETGFYLSRAQLERTLERINATTTRSFVLVLCHWKGEIRDWPLDADEVHEVALGFWPHHSTVVHLDAEYRLDIAIVTKTGPLAETGAER